MILTRQKKHLEAVKQKQYTFCTKKKASFRHFKKSLSLKSYRAAKQMKSPTDQQLSVEHALNVHLRYFQKCLKVDCNESGNCGKPTFIQVLATKDRSFRTTGSIEYFLRQSYGVTVIISSIFCYGVYISDDKINMTK